MVCPWQSRYRNSSWCASTMTAIPCHLKKGRSMSLSVIPKRRSAACCGLSTNPEVTTFIEKHSSARSRCPNQSRKQFWPLLDGSSRAAQRKVLSRSFRLVGTNEKVRRNLPRFADLVDHLDRECAAAHQNFRCTRPRAEEVSKFCLSVTELLDGIMQHIDRIEAPVHFDRPSLGFIDLDQCEQHIELVTFLGPFRCTPAGIDLGER